MTARPSAGPDAALYTPAEFAALIRVHVETLSQWDKEGRFPPGAVIRTPGGTRRYDGPWVRSLLAGAR
jgi:DNA-binding transcriptional MerR regulator